MKPAKWTNRFDYITGNGLTATQKCILKHFIQETVDDAVREVHGEYATKLDAMSSTLSKALREAV